MKNLNIFAIFNFFFVKSNLLKVKNCKTATFSRIFRGKKINKFKNFSPKKFKNFHVFCKKKIRQLFSWNRNFKGKIDNFTIYKENISTIFSKKSFDFWAKNENFEQCDILLLSELQTLKNRKKSVILLLLSEDSNFGARPISLFCLQKVSEWRVDKCQNLEKPENKASDKSKRWKSERTTVQVFCLFVCFSYHLTIF